MCRKKALNSRLDDGNELYHELFGVRVHTINGGGPTETDQERRDRKRVGQQNRESFHDYLRGNVVDKLYQELMIRADVVDRKAFNPSSYRPLIPKNRMVSALKTLGVSEAEAKNMAHQVNDFPADRSYIRKIVCEHTCTVCHQHQLKDGTRVLGFKSKSSTVELETADWSVWHRASALVGDRHNKGLEYITDMCQR